MAPTIAARSATPMTVTGTCNAVNAAVPLGAGLSRACRTTQRLTPGSFRNSGVTSAARANGSPQAPPSLGVLYFLAKLLHRDSPDDHGRAGQGAAGVDQ